MHIDEVDGLVVRAVSTAAERDRIRAVQAEIYTERGFVSSPDDPALDDRWVDQSIYLGAFHRSEIVGAARLIPYSDDLHLFDIFDIDPDWRRRLDQLPLADMAFELSALAVRRHAPGGRHSIIGAIGRAALHHAIRTQRYLVFAGVTPVLARILRGALNLPTETIGPKRPYLGAVRMPVLIDFLAFLQRGRLTRSPEWAYGLRGLEIDLREHALRDADELAATLQPAGLPRAI